MACVRFRRGSWGVDWRDALGARKWSKCETEGAAQKLLGAILAEHQPIRLPGYSELTLSDYAELWFREVAARSKPGTIARYRSAYRTHVAPELGHRRIAEISRFELKQHVATMHARGAALSMPVKVLSMLFASAYEDGMISRHPAKRLRRMFRTDDPPEAKAFTADELERFLAAAETEPLCVALFRTLALTGMRPGEARALQVQDVERSHLYVRRTFSDDGLSPYTKTKQRRRVEIPPELADELTELARWREPSAWLLRRPDGGSISRGVMRRAFIRIAKRAGLPDRFSPGCFRHSYASLLIQQGTSIAYVQRQLGHHDVHITVDTYGRWLDLSDQQALEKLVASVDAKRRRRVTTATVTGEEKKTEPPLKLLSFLAYRHSLAAGAPGTDCSRSVDDDDDPEGAA